MILTRLFLNPRSRDVRRAIVDTHDMHRRVMAMFADGVGDRPRDKLGILYRLDPADGKDVVVLLLQSSETPNAEKLPHGFLDPAAGRDAFATRSLESLVASLAVGARFRFRLRGNATKKIDTKSGPDGERRNGRRVPVRGEEAKVGWVVRRLDASGLRVLTDDFSAPLVRLRPEGSARGSGDIIHDSSLFEGVVEVVDVTKAQAALASGIGPGKAFGFGLLSLAPVA